MSAPDRSATDEVTFVFSGQGSQHGMMAKQLYDAHQGFRRTLQALDETARALCGASVVAAMFDQRRPRDAAWDELAMTHPAIFMVEYALAVAAIGDGVVPSRVMGTSLGAFAAAAVAGVVTADVALGMVVQQAAAIEACCEPGGMLAVLASPTTWIPRLSVHGEVAAINFDAHFVMSAPERGIRDMECLLASERVAFQRLPVGYAFHSRWIDPAEQVFLAHCAHVPLAPPRVPFICCERAAPLAELIPAHFWRVVRQPIRLAEATRHVPLASLYLDLGPSGTLATFLRYILPAPRRVCAVLARHGRDALDLRGLCAAATS